MENEISKGVWLGVGLVAIAIIMGVGFGIFTLADNFANRGSNQVEAAIDSVNSQVFNTFDQKVVSGNQITNFLNTNEGQPFAVMIRTKALANGRDIADDTVRPNVTIAAAGVSAPSDTELRQEVLNGKTFINYNAIIATDNNAKPDTQTAGVGYRDLPSGSLAQLRMDNGTYITSRGLASENGAVQYDNSIGGLFRTGNAEFIPANSRFQANLLKDPSGVILGIVVEQH